MLPVTELRAGTIFKEKGDIFEVISYTHTKIGRGSANVKIKAKNLKTGDSVQKTFMSGAKVEEGETEKKKLQFLYKDSDSLVFMDTDNYDQFPITTAVLDGKENFLKEDKSYEVLISGDTVLGVQLPNLMEFKVTETGPGVKGDTVSNVFKPATIENGMEIKVPLFINVGDRIKIDTRTDDYVERVK